MSAIDKYIRDLHIYHNSLAELLKEGQKDPGLSDNMKWNLVWATNRLKDTFAEVVAELIDDYVKEEQS